MGVPECHNSGGFLPGVSRCSAVNQGEDSMSKTETNGKSVESRELPRGWSWWSGSRSDTHYTQWFGTEYQMGGKLAGIHGLGGYDGEVYWDKGGKHHVAIYPVESIRDDGDPEIGEYPVVSASFESESEARAAVPRLITQLGD